MIITSLFFTFACGWAIGYAHGYRQGWKFGRHTGQFQGWVIGRMNRQLPPSDVKDSSFTHWFIKGEL